MTLRPSDGAEGRTRWLRALQLLFQKTWICCLSLVALGAAVRAPALQGPFLWDDNYLATANPFIKSPLLILEAFRHYLFLDSFSTHYRPVQSISMMPDYYLWGDNPFGFHLSNIMWHVAAGLVLFFLLRRLLNNLARAYLPPVTSHLLAFLLALLWMVHPVHSAAIDYISGRADSLAFFLAGNGWLTFLRARDSKSALTRNLSYAAAILLALLALSSRESALIWLILFLAHQLFVDRQTTRRLKMGVLAACVVLTLAYAGLRNLPVPRAHMGEAPDWTGPTRAGLMLRALGDYGRLMLFPSNLHMERSVFDPTLLRDSSSWRSHSRTEYLSLLGLGLLSAFAVGFLRKEPGRELRLVGAAWFLIAYLPTSNLIGVNATIAEHWLYLPSVGFLIFLAGCVLALPRQTHSWMVALAALFVAGLSLRSYTRSADWSGAERFFQQTLSSGGASSRAATNLALIYARRGEFARAEKVLHVVLKMTPDDPIARNNMADALRHLGRYDEAQEILVAAARDNEKVQKDYPRSWVIAANLARLRHSEKNDAAALAILDRAHAENPEIWELIAYEGELLREDKGPEAARQLVQQFAQKNWWHYGAALALGRLYAEEGNVVAANRALLQASRLDVRDVEALNLLAQIRLRQHRLDDAYLAQKRALRRQPDAPRQYALLSDILEKMGRTAEAKEAGAEVKRLENLARQNASLLN